MRKNRGFTLIELLIFTAIFTVVTIGFMTMLIAVLHVQSEETTATDVKTQGQFLLQQIQYYIQSARLVDMTPGRCDGHDAASAVRRFSFAGSHRDHGQQRDGVSCSRVIGGALQPLTSNKVAITNVSFTRHYNLNNSSTAYGADSVSFSFTMGAANASNTTQQYSQMFQSSAAVLAPMPKIALVQQTSTVIANTGQTHIAAAYASTNATGSLLVAVVANVSSSVATISLSDSAGNAWTKVASVPYAAATQQMAIFAAPNAKNALDTVSSTFGASVTNPSLSLFEYRGAATASSFDASSTQIQTSTASFGSGFANPASGAELIFGVIYVNPYPLPVTPAAGAGFTMEASSSVSHLFIEDEGLYVTGPVAATWSSAQAASSSAVVATFK